MIQGMIYQKTTAPLLFLTLICLGLYGQEQDGDYITFNDRSNVVHGVYVGISGAYGKLKGKDTYIGGLKVAYVANQKFEFGVAANFLYSQQNIYSLVTEQREDLLAGYAGLHLEPIFFSGSRINLSFPLLIGGGAVGYVDRVAFHNDEEFELEEGQVDAIFVLEPGIGLLFNISRYVQLEAAIKYRFSSQIELPQSPVDRIDGFSAGLGIKLGIFNMGRNRYKQKID